jgi:glycosyltransferase involved in cell wall biosynthesis
MKIVIAGDFGYPHGLAPVARISAYAKGLIKNGVDIKVICFKALERSDNGVVNSEARGIHDGVPFEYSCGTSFRAKSFLGRRWLEIKGGWGLGRLLREGGTQGKPDAIILFSNDPIWIILTVILSKLMGIKCIQEKSEFPFVNEEMPWWRKIYAAIYTRSIYKMFDGIIAISTFLEDYFSKRIRKGARVLRIPILVDTEQFKPEESPQPKGRHLIAFSGSLGHPGEVSSLMQAFSVVAGKYPEWDLQIIGDEPGTDMLMRLRKLAEDQSLSARIEFTGLVKHDDMPVYLRKAGILALLRSSGIFSTAGFPTKLGEYLSTAKPVVVTSVGDIPLFLQDRVSAYLVPPNDPEASAQKLDEVLANYDQALKVGQEGRQVAIREFDYRSNCQRIVEFVRKLQELTA